MTNTRFAVIVAGGSGSRMKSVRPKQFLLLHNKPILLHTIEKFLAQPNLSIVLVLPKTEIAYWNKEIVPNYADFISKTTDRLIITEGGATRFQSVKNGLAKIEATTGLVAIHDGVRPLISPEIIEKSFEMALEKKAVVVSVSLKDSARIIKPDGSNSMIDRNTIQLMQTPQTFDIQLIKAAFKQKEASFFTDDASVVEHYGYPISLIEGEYSNLKITTPEDLLIAERLLENETK